MLRLLLQLAGEGDPTAEVNALWPADRPLVELGRLEVTAISPTSASDERRMVWDPTNLTDGIDLRPIRSYWPDRPLTQYRTIAGAKKSEWAAG